MQIGPTATELERKTAWAESRVAEIMGVLNAATAELVSVLAEVLEAEAWAGYGFRSPEQWVTVKAGVSPGRAQSLVAMARRLQELPAVASAFAEGRLTEDSVKVVVAHTPPERDEEVAGLAAVMLVPQLSRVLRTVPKPAPEEPAEIRPAVVAFGHEDGGRFFLRARGLAAESGALVATALEASREDLFAAGMADVTWADALERMAAAALDALASGARGGDRFQVVVHVEAETKATSVHLGPALDRATRRRLSCGDASLRWVLESQGHPIAYGRNRRTVSRVLRRLVEHRDGGCRVPGCAQRRWVQVHHLTHWEDGGLTVPENLLCLCPAHHRLHHQGRLHIEGNPTTADGLVFTDARGQPIRGPDPVPPAGSVTEAARALRLRFGAFEPPLGERLDPGAFGWN